MMMAMAPAMGMPKMDIPGTLAGMLPGDRLMGWIMHFLIGIVWAVIFALLWAAGIGSAGVLWGIVFGIGAFVVAGLAMPMMLSMHPQVQAGNMPNPGLFMSRMGMMATVGSLMGHVLFGLVVGLVYVLIA